MSGVSQWIRRAKKLYDLNRDEIRRARGRWQRRTVDDHFTLADEVHSEAKCYFVLSTGRCGTAFLTELLRLSPEIDCHHAPSPELVLHSRLAYEAVDPTSETFALGVDMARYEMIRDAYLTERTFVETNNRITFLAPALERVYARAKFIHLVRHPAAVVRSGIRREYYSGRNPHDAGHLLPRDNTPWDEMTQLERVAWLWNETNAFIERFKGRLDKDRIFFLRAEDLFRSAETAMDVFRFLDVSVPSVHPIRRLLRRPVNVQHEGSFPEYAQWSVEEKGELSRWAHLAEKYGYELARAELSDD